MNLNNLRFFVLHIAELQRTGALALDREAYASLFTLLRQLPLPGALPPQLEGEIGPGRIIEDRQEHPELDPRDRLQTTTTEPLRFVLELDLGVIESLAIAATYRRKARKVKDGPLTVRATSNPTLRTDRYRYER